MFCFLISALIFSFKNIIFTYELKVDVGNVATYLNYTSLFLVEGAVKTKIVEDIDGTKETFREEIKEKIRLEGEGVEATEKNVTNNTSLIIHVGPVKTGTTSIQCNLHINPFLKESSYEYLGKDSEGCEPTHYRQQNYHKLISVRVLIFEHILRGRLKQSANEYVESVKKMLENKNNKGINTIISAEEFCGLRLANKNALQDFVDFLNSIKQTIRFKVVYRDFFEWALSSHYYYQQIKLPVSFTGKSLFSIGHKKSQHIFFGTKECSPYRMWSVLKSILPTFQRAHLDILNFHEKGDLSKRFICSLPHADAACKGSNRINLEISRSTDYNQIHADRIATAVWRKELFFNSSAVKNRRKEIREVIIDYVHNGLKLSFLELPLNCLEDKQLAALLQISIQSGTEMLGATFNVDAMKAKFDTFLARKKFCSVDVNKVVMEPAWQLFFKNETLFG